MKLTFQIFINPFRFFIKKQYCIFDRKSGVKKSRKTARDVLVYKKLRLVNANTYNQNSIIALL